MASGIRTTSNPPSASTVEDSISTHANSGRTHFVSFFFSRVLSLARSLSNSSVAEVLLLSMPHMLLMYSLVIGWNIISLPRSMKHTLAPGLMPYR